MTQTTHTPKLPLSVKPSWLLTNYIYDAYGTIIAETFTQNAICSRDFIVTACNSHADLLEALKTTVERLSFHTAPNDLRVITDKRVIEEARAAIAKAEAQK